MTGTSMASPHVAGQAAIQVSMPGFDLSVACSFFKTAASASVQDPGPNTTNRLLVNGADGQKGPKQPQGPNKPPGQDEQPGQNNPPGQGEQPGQNNPPDQNNPPEQPAPSPPANPGGEPNPGGQPNPGDEPYPENQPNSGGSGPSWWMPPSMGPPAWWNNRPSFGTWNHRPVWWNKPLSVWKL